MNKFFKLWTDWYWRRIDAELWWMESEPSPQFVPINLVLTMMPLIASLLIGYVSLFCWLNELATEDYIERVRFRQTARQPVQDWQAVSSRASKSQGTPSSPREKTGAARGLAPIQ